MSESVFGGEYEPPVEAGSEEVGGYDAAYGEEPLGYDDYAEEAYTEPNPEHVAGLEQLAREYPDIRQPEVLEGMVEYLEELVERTGDESLMTDPRYVKLAYEATRSVGPDEVMDRIANTQRDGVF